MRLNVLLSVVILSFASATFAQAEEAADRRRRLQDRRAKLASMSVDEKKRLLEKKMGEGKGPIVSKAWPTWSDEQKNQFVSADKTTRRQMIRDFVKNMPEEERKSAISAFREKNQARFGDGAKFKRFRDRKAK